MPYILNKTNGTVLTTVGDATIDLTTNLSFVGRNYSGYGESVNENFVKLLENFSNTTAPTRPVMGQLWFDSLSSNKRLNVCYDGKNFKGIANISVQSERPTNLTKGDLWWDTFNSQLKSFDGSNFVIIGPQSSSASKSTWQSAEESSTEDTLTKNAFLKGLIGSTPVATISKETFTPVSSSDLYSSFNVVKKGITLPGADKNTGSSQTSGYYFWGTAAESLKSTTATNVVVNNDQTTNRPFYVTFASTSSGNNQLFASSNLNYNPFTDTLNFRASAAVYADLAERYESDSIYDVGTVVVIGGPKEITVSHTYADTSVAGIVSKNPAYMMNSAAGSDETHPYIALKGRVPCKVFGRIDKGCLLVTSSHPGYAAMAGVYPPAGSIIGKALGSQSEGFGVVEVLVV
jgi:hypothetical protein